MTNDADRWFSDRTVRLWMAVQVAAMVAWLCIAAVLAIASVSIALVLVVMATGAIAFSYLIDPRRSWWGPGPMAVMTIPESRRRYQRSIIVRLISAVVVGCVIVVALVATGTVMPVQT